jgi:hypothetical protein
VAFFFYGRDFLAIMSISGRSSRRQRLVCRSPDGCSLNAARVLVAQYACCSSRQTGVNMVARKIWAGNAAMIVAISRLLLVTCHYRLAASGVISATASFVTRSTIRFICSAVTGRPSTSPSSSDTIFVSSSSRLRLCATCNR